MLDLDGVLLDQVLFNLLDNASKYAPVMSTISIRARQINDSVIVQVTDEGPGIPSDHLERIFDKFYRAKAAIASERARAWDWPSAAASSRRWAVVSSPAKGRLLGRDLHDHLAGQRRIEHGAGGRGS
jgi:hypothetical protein